MIDKFNGFVAALLAGVLGMSDVAVAQDTGSDEVIVTAKRRDADDFVAEMPAVGLRRSADFAVQEVTITSDSRDPQMRRDEIFGMIAAAIAAAPHAGIDLAYGAVVVQPLTLQSYRGLTLERADRPDTQKVSILVKVALGEGSEGHDAENRVAAFVKSVKPVGRALMEESGDLTLSVVAPDQYRAAIAEAVATDARAMAARVGDGYGVEIEGLNHPVEWARRGLTEVLLYIPYKLVVRPK